MAKVKSPDNKGQKVSFGKKRKSKNTKPRNKGACARGRQKFFGRQKQKGR